jgi:hypothetical protein
VITLDTAGGQPGQLRSKALASAGLAVQVLSNLGYLASADGGDHWSKPRPDWAGEAIAADQKGAGIVGVEVGPGRNRLFVIRILSEIQGKPQI